MRDERGGMLMEYVLINVIIILFLIGAASPFFDLTGQPQTTDAVFNMPGTVEGSDYGILGNSMVEVYRRIMKGIALPIP